MVNKTTKKIQNVTNKKQIVDAAYKLMLAGGYSATSLRDIAKEAGVSIGGIYSHFENKNDIYFQIIKDVIPFRNIIPIVSQNMGEDPEEFFRAIARDWAECFSFDEFRFMFIDWVEFKGDNLLKYFEMELHNDPSMGGLLSCYQGWVDAGKVKDYNFHLVLKSLIQSVSLFLVANEFFFGNKQKHKHFPDESLDQLVDIFMHGIIN